MAKTIETIVEKKLNNPNIGNGIIPPTSSPDEWKVTAAPRASGTANLSSGISLSRLKIGQGHTAIVAPLTRVLEKPLVHEVEKQRGGKSYYQCLAKWMTCPMCQAEWPQEKRALIPVYDLKRRQPCYLEDTDTDAEKHLIYQVETFLALNPEPNLCLRIKREQFNDYEVTVIQQDASFFEAESYKRAVQATQAKTFSIAGVFPRLSVEVLHNRFSDLSEHIKVVSGAH